MGSKLLLVILVVIFVLVLVVILVVILVSSTRWGGAAAKSYGPISHESKLNVILGHSTEWYNRISTGSIIGSICGSTTWGKCSSRALSDPAAAV